MHADHIAGAAALSPSHLIALHARRLTPFMTGAAAPAEVGTGGAQIPCESDIWIWFSAVIQLALTLLAYKCDGSR